MFGKLFSFTLHANIFNINHRGITQMTLGSGWALCGLAGSLGCSVLSADRAAAAGCSGLFTVWGAPAGCSLISLFRCELLTSALCLSSRLES